MERLWRNRADDVVDLEALEDRVVPSLRLISTPFSVSRTPLASAATSGTGLGLHLDATANWITAALCSVTANLPTPVCSDPVIAGLETRIPVQ